MPMNYQTIPDEMKKAMQEHANKKHYNYSDRDITITAFMANIINKRKWQIVYGISSAGEILAKGLYSHRTGNFAV